MFGKLHQTWQRWRADSRQRQVDRALYKAGGGGLPTRQATRGNAYVGDVRHGERAAGSVRPDDSADDPS